MCMAKPYHVLAKRFGLFAVRPPSLSRGKWTWGCGITLDTFTHDIHGSSFFLKFINIQQYKIQCNGLGDGYNVATCK